MCVNQSSKYYLHLFAVILLHQICGHAYGDTTRTQLVTLNAGWNAISIDVDPTNPLPSSIFDTTKVDVVARFFTPPTPVQFITDPAEQTWNVANWGVWYAPDRAEAFLNSLHSIQGGYAYLVHAKLACSIEISGEVRYKRMRWVSDSFNLTGFPVEGSTPPTFSRFFAGAGNRLGGRIYRLVDGSWQKIINPATTTIRPGEACWVYCEGNTTYQGPLELRLTGSELNFGDTASSFTIEYANRVSSPYSVQVAVESGNGFPLYRSALDLSGGTTNASPIINGTSLGTLAGDATDYLRLQLRRELMPSTSGSAILKFSTGDGIALRIPVRVSLP